MRDLARSVAKIILGLGVTGALAAFVLGLNSFGDRYGSGGNGLILVGVAIGMFCSSASAAAVLSLLASIDERLEVAGLKLPTNSPTATSADRSVFEEQFGSEKPDAEAIAARMEFQRKHGRN